MAHNKSITPLPEGCNWLLLFWWSGSVCQTYCCFTDLPGIILSGAIISQPSTLSKAFCHAAIFDLMVATIYIQDVSVHFPALGLSSQDFITLLLCAMRWDFRSQLSILAEWWIFKSGTNGLQSVRIEKRLSICFLQKIEA